MKKIFSNQGAAEEFAAAQNGTVRHIRAVERRVRTVPDNAAVLSAIVASACPLVRAGAEMVQASHYFRDSQSFSHALECMGLDEEFAATPEIEQALWRVIGDCPTEEQETRAAQPEQWEVTVPEPSHEPRVTDVIDGTGKWCGSDDSGGWFGGD